MSALTTCTVTCTADLDADPGSVWRVWSDMPAYPTWDEREEETRLDGPFVAGTTGFSKQRGGRAGSTFRLLVVGPGRRWVNECPLPMGRLVIDHRMEQLGADRVRVTKTYAAHGPMSVVFRLFYARGIRAEMPASFAALGAEACRRTTNA